MTLILIYAPLAFVLGMEFGLWLAGGRPALEPDDIDWEN